MSLGALSANLRLRLGTPLFRAFTVLFAVEAVLIVVNIARMPGVLRLGHEGGFPTFLHSGVLMAVAAVLLATGLLGMRAIFGWILEPMEEEAHVPVHH